LLLPKPVRGDRRVPPLGCTAEPQYDPRCPRDIAASRAFIGKPIILLAYLGDL
jgi:hypothetical protein